MIIIKAGEMFRLDGGATEALTSPFVQKKIDQEQSSYDHHSWKQGGEEDGNLIPRGMLWSQGRVAKPYKPQIVYVRQVAGRIYYVLELSKAKGLFYRDTATGQEVRLFHRQEFDPNGLFITSDYKIVTTRSDDGINSHLIFLDENGKEQQVVTSGDCRDEHPFQYKDTLYYQTSGIARSQDGKLAIYGPTSINKIDMRTGELSAVIADDRYDFILPQVGPDGTLYCIRTPHKAPGSMDFKTFALDVVLFPWRLLRAFFAYLNFFSLMYTRKPLKTAGGPSLRDLDINRRVIHNKMLDIERNSRQEGRKVAAPRDWQLVKIQDGKAEVLARNVLWYDFDALGELIYTDGFTVRDAAGKARYESEELVTQVACG